ncbi:hypothetical protein G6F26_000843 [Rhizopus arrhizus]|nr:hypothetical protein G6F24_001605 [Rhizopus arrhizus]KAG0875502.1 hypothetical protein G6F16_003009 [Rhizopus arrhizus]KAG0889382.1 hypothetical protein G6F15_000740 [Rhizopus arrhizus]KAG0903452.1 hypothetical protein G6F34_001107 [Rhizopus arrhizus]KAG0917449.1 hypothetical protein G6F33_001475 [Rhizopus arrhizus]
MATEYTSRKENEPIYGSAQVQRSSRLSTSSLNQPSEDHYSDHGGSSEEFASIKLARRRKKRLQKHHESNRPKLVSKLSHIVRSATQSEEEDNKDDIIQMPSDDLILPELDQNAAEVREYVSSPMKSLDSRVTRKHKVNLSTIREKYREARFIERNGNQPFTKGKKLMRTLKYDTRILKTKQILFGNKSIILFVYTDLLVDMILCLSYLIEMKQEAGIVTEPFWLFKWRSRFLWLLCVMLSLWNFASFLMHKPIDALKTKLIHLAGTIIVLLYNGLSAFQYCEVTFGNVNYSILDSLYVVMVTLSTVGYGDITPQTEGSRIVMMLLIVISLAVLPNLIADALSTLRKRNDWGGYVSDSSKPFILIIGSFRAEQVTEILDGFLNTQARSASAIFTLSGPSLNSSGCKNKLKIHSLSIDQHTSDPQKEDERNTVRLWSLYCHTVVHNVDIYTYNLSPSTAVYQKMAKEIICVGEFKQYLLAMNCRCRGASTLLTNLLHQRRPMDHYDESWQAQYDDGSCNEIYMDKPPSALVGLSFKEAAWVVYTECQAILFGVKTYLDSPEHREMLLNPEDNYIIKADDLCVYMCESPRELNDVNALNIKYVREKIDIMLAKRTAEYGKLPGTSEHAPPAPSSSSSSVKNDTKTVNEPISASNEESALNNIHSSGPGSPMPQSSTRNLYHTNSAESTRTMASIRQKFQLAKLPTPRMALLTGSRRLVSRLGQLPSLENPDADVEDSPLCYLLDEPAKLHELTIESAENLTGHIVGDCQHPDDLIKAGVKRAKQVVVMSESECLDLHQRTSDSPAIMTSHLLDLLLQDRPHGSSRIVNLVEKSNIRFMHLLQGKDVAEEIDVFYTPAYAAGNVVVDNLLSNVLLSQTYYKPDIVSVIKALCGMPGPLYDKDTEHMLTCRTKFHPYFFKNSRHLMLILMPPSFIDKPFSALFESLILDHEVLTLGLLRAPDENMGNELSFVYTNPVPSLVLKRTDRVYVLASPGWSYFS